MYETVYHVDFSPGPLYIRTFDLLRVQISLFAVHVHVQHIAICKARWCSTAHRKCVEFMFWM